MTVCARALCLLAALACAAGCDYAQRKEQKSERADRHYHAAMSDYSAGRIDAAIAGFEKSVRANPGNASARFQLACLLQDRRQDYLGALCNYREYIALDPSGDKARLAKDRAALCEKLLSAEAVRRAGAGGTASADDLEAAQRQCRAVSNALANAERQAKELAGRIEALSSENARLRRMIATAGAESGPSRPKTVDASALLDADDEEDDRLTLSPGAVALFEEEERADTSEAPRPGDGDGRTLVGSVRSLAQGGGASERRADEPAHEERPEFYVVQEGDTLYRIALRFYGRRDAWKKIQEANKATVSSDARIKVGQKIRLP